MKEKMKKDADWLSIQKDKSPINLYLLIEKITLSQTDDIYPYAGLNDALISLFSLRQDNMSNGDYYETLQALYRNLQAHKSQLTNFTAQLDALTANQPEANLDNCTLFRDLSPDQQEPLQAIVEEQFLAYLMLRQSSAKHSQLFIALKNGFQYKHPSYPPSCNSCAIVQ
jgi:hypothetical protein